MSNNDNSDVLSAIGERGFIVFDGGNFYAINESRWRKSTPHKMPQPTDSVNGQIGTLIGLKAALAALDETPNTVFVDLDRFAALDETDGSRTSKGISPKESLPKLDTAKGRTLVVRESASVFVIPESMWGQPIPPSACGDARVLVNRGAVVASIPKSPLPVGTFCVLVNFAGIFKS